MLADNEQSAAPFWSHRRVVTPALLALGVAVLAIPTFLARGAPWLAAWVDCSLTAVAFATTLKCFSTSRRLRGQQRTAWILISSAFFSYGLAEALWLTNEVILGVANPIPSIADVGYMSAPILLAIGIWLYRTDSPTLSEGVVQLGNTGILIAAIFLANLVVFQQLVTSSLAPGQLWVLFTYSVIAPTASIFALFNIIFYMRGPRLTVMMPLLIALGSLAISDYTTAYEFVAGSYSAASYGNVGYIITLAFGSWAAFEQDYIGQILEADRDPRRLDEIARRWETLLPPLALAGMMTVVLTHRQDLTLDLVPHATGALLLFSAAIALRDWWSQRIASQLREESIGGAAALRQSEQRLLAKNEELAAANRELSKEVITRKHIQEELRHSQKMEAIGQLTGGVAHDFNNLLAVIVGNVDLLEHTLEPESSQRVYTREALAAANRGAALTDRLLAFSRKQALDPRPIGLDDLFKSMTGLLERTLGETIQMRFEVSADVAPCMIDRAQLENAILNLVINARDAMRGGGSITIEASNVTLSALDVQQHPDASPGDYVSISVRDTGVGMSAQVQARVFEPFFTTKDIGAGSGLGLSMVYGFVNQSGGHVSIESTAGSGTEVRLYIPRTDQSPDPIEDIDADTVPAGNQETVLVVEDDPALGTVIVSSLEQQGYQVVTVMNGSDALAILDERGPFDLLLSDVILPGEFSGPELANVIARRHPSMKILLMSGYASDALEETAGQSDYPNLLQKPFSMGKLARKIRSVLEPEEGVDSVPD